MIVYSPDAEADVERHHEWLMMFSVRAAEAYDKALARVEVRIAESPLTFRVLGDGQTRRATFRLRRTTYHVDFRQLPDGVVVLRVWHGRQDRPD